MCSTSCEAKNSVIDVWAKIAGESSISDKNTCSVQAPNFVFVGPKGSGKTSLIKSFLSKGKSDKLKPTMCLDYQYTRLSSHESSEKTLCHIWEIGGGRSMSLLTASALKPDVLQRSLIILTADLSKPSSIPSELKFWIDIVKLAIVESIKKLGVSAPHIVAAMETEKQERLPQQHPDRSKIKLMHVPVLIVATKFDTFCGRDIECLNVMAYTLRALALTYGTGLMYYSNSSNQLQSSFRVWLMRHGLGKQAATTCQLEHTHALNVPSCFDTFEQIGIPNDARTQNPARAWIDHFKKKFEETEEEANSADKLVAKLDFSKLENEPLIDEAWKQKRESLHQQLKANNIKRDEMNEKSQIKS